MTLPAMATNDLTLLSAVDLAAAIRAGAVSAVEATDAYLGRIDRLNPRLNAVVISLADEARATARRVDEVRSRGERLGPLAGVPITIKDSFDVLGTPSTLGLASRKSMRPSEEGPIVRQLRAAGAVIVGKTNVPMIMLSSDTDNRVFGLTRHPERDDRGPGGSSGGEGAAVAARLSAMGLGSDLLGSIRQPAHACGIHGFKPTMPRFSMVGASNCLGGMEAIVAQPGPMARHMCDVRAFLDVLLYTAEPSYHEIDHHGDDPYAIPSTWRDPAQVDPRKLRIGIWESDPMFAPSPAVSRVVRRSAEILRERGAEVVEYQPPESERAWRLCLALISASGAANVRGMLGGERPTAGVARSLQVWGMPAWQRATLAQALDWLGQPWRAKLVRWCRGGSAADYWRLVQERKDYVRMMTADLHRKRIDAIITPPNGLPALPHRTANDILPACVFAFVPSLLGLPAGTVAASRVRPDEDRDRGPARELVAATARRVDAGSVGLPIGVQVASRLWRDDVALAIMQILESEFATEQDYPLKMAGR